MNFTFIAPFNTRNAAAVQMLDNKIMQITLKAISK